MPEIIRVWCIGPDRTEYYAARSEAEMREYYTALVGKETASEDFADYFEEVTDEELDYEFDFQDEERGAIKTTWRKEAALYSELPVQIGTSYN